MFEEKSIAAENGVCRGAGEKKCPNREKWQ
jgi:hypothetical protein